MPIKLSFVWALIITLAAAVIALAVNLQLAFWLLFFAAIGWWAWTTPHQALCLFIVLAPLWLAFKMTQTVGTFTLLKDVIILTLFIKLFAWPLLTRQLPYRRALLMVPSILLVGWVAFATLRADSVVLGILRARDIVLYLMLYFVVLYLPVSKQFYRQALVWFLVSATIVGALGWYQFAAVPDSAVLRFDPARQVWIPRVSSIMAHPSIFGQYLVLVSTLLLALVMTQSRYRWIYAGLLVFFLPLVYLTYSRAVWLGYAGAVGALLAVWLWGKIAGQRTQRLPWKTIGLGAVVLLLLIAAAVQLTSLGTFIRSAIDPTYASNAERLDFLVRLIAPLTNTQALIGAGLGDVVQQNFRTVEVETFDITSGASRSVQLAKDATLVDNQYLKTFIEMGLAGLLIYCWLYWLLLKSAFNVLSVEKVSAAQTQNSKFKTQSSVVALWTVGFCAAFIVQAFFIDIWDIFPTNAAFWIIAALVSREQTPYTKNYGEE